MLKKCKIYSVQVSRAGWARCHLWRANISLQPPQPSSQARQTRHEGKILGFHMFTKTGTFIKTKIKWIVALKVDGFPLWMCRYWCWWWRCRRWPWPSRWGTRPPSASPRWRWLYNKIPGIQMLKIFHLILFVQNYPALLLFVHFRYCHFEQFMLNQGTICKRKMISLHT